MEQQEKNLEKSELFEGLKSKFAKSAKDYVFILILFVLGFTLAYLGGVKNHLDISGHATDLMILVIGLIACVHNIIWYRKLSKSDNIKTFLSSYDKYKKCNKWVIVALAVFLLAFLIIRIGFNIGLVIVTIVTASGLLILYWMGKGATGNLDKDIKQLRELDQQEG